MNKHTKTRQTLKYREQTGGCQKGGGGRVGEIGKEDSEVQLPAIK